jgi:hypothetical protein
MQKENGHFSNALKPTTYRMNPSPHQRGAAAPRAEAMLGYKLFDFIVHQRFRNATSRRGL